MLSFGVSAFQLFGVCAVPPVPPDLAGRVEYALRYMPWGLVSFLGIAVVFAIGIAYVADPKGVVPRVVSCACGRRQATLTFDGGADNSRFISVLTSVCPWCQTEARPKTSVPSSPRPSFPKECKR